MKGDTKIIELLNELLREELSAINQYFLHARMCKNWGYEKLGAKIMAGSVEEMKHARSVADRILFLEGLPSLQTLNKLNIGEDVPEMLRLDLQRELAAVSSLQKGINACYDVRDHGTRELLEGILREEEEHVDWLEAQLEVIKTCGVENYLADQLASER